MISNFIDALSSSRIYPITDKKISGLSHAEQVARLSDRGATLIQVREKLASPKEFLAEAEAALKVARARGVRIIINDRVDIALAVGADGVHLGQDDLPPAAVRSLLGPKAIIGFSTHNLDQVRLAIELPIDYLAIGPIFPTSTKESTNPAVGLEGLARVKEIVGRLPLVAIGGITSENSGLVLETGASAFAVISDLWRTDTKTPNKSAAF